APDPSQTSFKEVYFSREEWALLDPCVASLGEEKHKLQKGSVCSAL
uniref:KRAB domain-containing protein n=1 Tax=Pavo cristatus TaxID=9049 RepID=A0A8C9F2H8_PAVCR